MTKGRIGRYTLWIVVCLFVVSTCYEMYGAPPKKQTPRVRPKKSPDTTMQRAIPSWIKLNPPLPDSTKGSKKTAKTKSTVFETFKETAECKMSKPIMIYFYWPEEEKPSTMTKSCAAFEKNLGGAGAFLAIAEQFGRFTCDAKGLDKKLRSAYATTVPRLSVFDPAGKLLLSMNRFPTSDKALAKKLEALKKECDKLLSKSQATEAKTKAKKKETTKKKAGKKEKKKDGEEPPEGDQ